MRPLTMDDIPAMVEVVNRGNVADGIPQVVAADELVEDLSGDAYDLARRSQAAVAADGTLVGFSTVEHTPAAELGFDEQTCHVDGSVDPRWRRQGIGTSLLGWSVECSTGVLRAADDDLPKRIRFGVHEAVPDIATIAGRAGFVPVRWFEDLVRSLDGELPAPTEVDGLRIERWPIGRDEELREVKNEAFRDHWGSSRSTAQEWQVQLHGHTGRPGLSFVAYDEASGAPVALLVTARFPDDDAVLGRVDGWVQTLATLRPWRGRGVGSTLIAHALRAYVDEGFTHASIGVDSENPSGAARLYRNLGFELDRRAVVFQLELD